MAIAAIALTLTTSPTPFAPSAFTRSSGSSINETSIEIPDVRIHGHRILCKAVVEKAAIARIYFTGFAQGRFDSPDDTAIRLAHRSAPTDDPASIDYANVAGHMGSRQVWVNSDFGEMGNV